MTRIPNRARVADATGFPGAPSHVQEGWKSVERDSIDWKTADGTVHRLQTRIVKAHKAGKTAKVKALQRLLTHSFSGKALAVKRVTENTGKKTCGVDSVVWNTPRQKKGAVHS